MPGDYETFENTYLDLRRAPGKTRFAASGMGWKSTPLPPPRPGAPAPPHTNEMWTMSSNEFVQAHWSRASKGYELKIFTRTLGIVQVDGFEQDVSSPPPATGNHTPHLAQAN